MKIILLAWLYLAAISIGDAAAQIVSRDSIHLKSPGSVVRGSFVLVNKVVPLPEGEFTLIGTSGHESKFISGDFARQEHKMVNVFLGQVVDRKLRAAVGATTVLAWGGGRREWISESCKRDDTLFRINLTPFMKRNYEENCLLVNHVVNSLGPSSTGIYAKVDAWIRDQGGTTPIATVIAATVTRISVGEYLSVRYVFDPEAYGCDGVLASQASAKTWAASAWHKKSIHKDEEKKRFADGVVALGREMQARVDDGFSGHAPRGEVAAAPTLPRCGATATQAAPPVRKASEKPPVVADRLRALDELRDQKLITPAEYEERRKKILDSL